MTIEHIRLRDAQLDIDAGVAVFTHLRPEARNALSDRLRLDYAQMLDRVGGDRSVRALIVTGSGGSFCAGGDLKAMVAPSRCRSRTFRRKRSTSARACCTRHSMSTHERWPNWRPARKRCAWQPPFHAEALAQFARG